MKTKRAKGVRLLLPFLCLITGCSTAKPAKTSSQEMAVIQARQTHFEIVYSLAGHSEHRLTGSSGPTGPHMASYLERELIGEAAVQTQSYDRYLEKLLSFAQKPGRAPSQQHDCRSPFSITINIDGKTNTSKGCRVRDDGQFAKLVREGEFLLYSKK